MSSGKRDNELAKEIRRLRIEQERANRIAEAQMAQESQRCEDSPSGYHEFDFEGNRRFCKHCNKTLGRIG